MTHAYVSGFRIAMNAQRIVFPENDNPRRVLSSSCAAGGGVSNGTPDPLNNTGGDHTDRLAPASVSIPFHSSIHSQEGQKDNV